MRLQDHLNTFIPSKMLVVLLAFLTLKDSVGLTVF